MMAILVDHALLDPAQAIFELLADFLLGLVDLLAGLLDRLVDLLTGSFSRAFLLLAAGQDGEQGRQHDSGA